MNQKSLVLFAATLAAAICYVLLASVPYPPAVCWTGAITLLCAILWITEALPIPVTALIAIALFPSVGVLTPAEVGQAVGSPTVLLVLGGFILSASMVSSGAHRRVALGMVNLIGGTSSRRIVFGFMCAAAFLSMWISNAATSLMLLPVALAIIERAEDPKLATPLLLGLAYASSIGGLGTPIGTPANLVFIENYAIATGEEVSFTQWMRWGLPVALVLLPVCFFWVTRGLTHRKRLELPGTGQWQTPEKRVLCVFAVTALAWMTRSEPFGGWSGLVGLPDVTDTSIAIIAAISLFIVPDGHGGKLLDWEGASRIPWGILILLGSGFAIARAFSESGLSAILGEGLSGLSGLPILLMIAGLCLVVTFMTELTSNTATTTLLMPVLAAAAFAAGFEDPALMMLPAALTASCAFMLPTATTPNTVAFSTGRFPLRKMVSEGMVLNLLGVIVVTLLSYWMLR
ncbi:MAG TPA: SLC13 family permease [Gammaproteobacteria bacterium]|nr:SLC13 family permease [Gammaproteobacteria bacterium]